MKYTLTIELTCYAVCIALISCTTGILLKANQFHAEAIQHNAARYNAKTGAWEWIVNPLPEDRLIP